MKGNIIRFDHHETGEEISAIVVGETTDGNLRLKLHKDRTGEKTWFCESEEVKEVIGEVEDKENLRQMGRYSVQNAIESAEEDDEDTETEVVTDGGVEVEETESTETVEELVDDLKEWADEEDHEGSPESFGYGKETAFRKAAREIEGRLLENGSAMMAEDVEAIINRLIEAGLSPGQAWSYYGVEVRGHSRNEWSKKCGYSNHSAVSEPLRKANDKLESLSNNRTTTSKGWPNND